MTPEALATALSAADSVTAARLTAEIRRLSVLAEVAETVTQQFSLDHQLPQLIDLITDALGAERATLFLHDGDTGELFSRVLHGEGVAEIRVPASAGIAGAVFTSGAAEIIADAYQDPRFNPEIDHRTGYHTHNVLCVPLRNRAGQAIGVTQVLNKRSGDFGEDDVELVEAINRHAASALEQALLVERLEQAQREEEELLAITEAISSELRLDTLFTRIMGASSQLLNAERSTLFVYDAAREELWSQVAEGTNQKQIRIPSHAGLAGVAFTTGEVLDIPDAYADPRFNRTVDRATGYRTRNLLVGPVTDREGQRLGVVQVLNKRGGAFSPRDVRRLKAFCAEIAIAISNAKLFSDVLYLKNYNESILKSLSNGVVTLDDELTIVKVNDAAGRILGLSEADVLNRLAGDVFDARNPWVTRSLGQVVQSGTTDYHADTDYVLPDGGRAAVNMTAAPLFGVDDAAMGYMLVIDDITREKRVRSTMARYVAKEVVDQLLAGDQDFLQGTSHPATVLFADIRHFTTIAEAMTPRDTVTMLNEYFTAMVDVVFEHGGMLDKYIGDALMAVFGTPVTHPDDPDHALAVATEMIQALARFNALREAAGAEPIEIGVGVATGEVLAGSLGSRRRLEYTVIGDNVNLASRLEGANKFYGTRVLLSGSTVEALHSRPLLRRLDLLQVKGKLQPTEVYESLAHIATDPPPRLRGMVLAYEAGFARYQRRDWAGALQHFGEALELVPSDLPSQIFIGRCQYFRNNPPPEDWDGVWIMEEK